VGISLLIDGEVPGGHGIDLRDDGARAQPIHDLIFIAAGRRRVRGRLRDDERRTESARHFLRDGDDVVAAGPRISGQAVVVRRAEAAKVQFDEFGALRIPLENDRLRSVMPERRADDEILIDNDVRVTVAFGSREAALVFAFNGRKSFCAGVTVDLAVFVGKVTSATSLLDSWTTNPPG
jgi:hypothetical protein